MTKHKEKLNRSKLRIITFISFFIGFTQAGSMYVLSTFFENVVGANMVGYFFAGAYIFFLIILLNLHKIINVIGKSGVFALACLFEILILCLLIFLSVTNMSVYLAASYLIFSMLAFVALDVILEGYSEDKFSGRIRGLYLTVYNFGLLFGPFVSIWILERFDFDGVFSFVLLSCILILIIFIISVGRVKHRHRARLKVKDALHNFLKRKNVVRIYYVSLILEAFYALMVIYAPIYLREVVGLSWSEIGLAFTVMLIPFVLIQYPAGILADEKYGEKEFLIFSLILMAISTGIIYFVFSQSLFFWAVLLFVTRIGAALIEVLRDSYFYKQIDGEDVDLIDFFRTAMPVGYISATLVSSILLIFFPMKIVFVVIAIFALSGLYPVFKLKDSR